METQSQSKMNRLKFLRATTAILLAGFVVAHASVPVTNSGFTFKPATINITTKDTVVFTLASIHNAQEVSLATYTANDTTALSGGFSVPFGGGRLSGLAAGIHYFVCSNHASMGMKGQLWVQEATTTTPIPKSLGAFTFQVAGSRPITFKMSGETELISVMDMKGRTVWSMTMQKNGIRNLTWDRKLADGNNLAAGAYFVQLTLLNAVQKPIGKISRTLVQIR